MKNHFTIATLATLLMAGSLSAQQTSPEQPQTSSPQANPSESEDIPLTKEQMFAKCLAIANQEEVWLAKFAKEHTSSEQVKALATTLEKSHQACLDELKAIATKAAAARKETNPTVAVANINTHAMDFLKLHQEMSDQCLKDSKEMLSKKKDSDFDACFVGMQIAKHGMMHSSLTVLQKHTTGELQGFIKASLVKNDEHMQAATKLMDQLSDTAAARTARAK
ncbi:MAG: DUF4142 domain-containing protein [Pirellula sp.]